MVDNRTWADKIRALKEQKNAVILAHYYTRPEVQQMSVIAFTSTEVLT